MTDCVRACVFRNGFADELVDATVLLFLCLTKFVIQIHTFYNLRVSLISGSYCVFSSGSVQMVGRLATIWPRILRKNKKSVATNLNISPAKSVLWFLFCFSSFCCFFTLFHTYTILDFLHKLIKSRNFLLI